MSALTPIDSFALLTQEVPINLVGQHAAIARTDGERSKVRAPASTVTAHPQLLITQGLTCRLDSFALERALKHVGPCGGIEEHFYAMGTEKKVVHPLGQRLLPARS